MKNLKLLLMVSSIAFLNGCGQNLEASATYSPSLTTTPSTQSTDKSTAVIEPKLLQEYQKSQNKLIELLTERVNAKNDEAKLDKIRQALLKELPNFKKQIYLAEKSTKNTPNNTKITELKQVIIFDDLSTKEKVEELQGKLKLKDLGNEKGQFGKKTKDALVEKIQSFGKELETLSRTESNKTGSNPTPSPTPSDNPPKPTTDLSWVNTLSLILSLLSIIGTSAVMALMYLWYHRNKLSPKNRIEKIEQELKDIKLNTEENINAETDSNIESNFKKEIENLSQEVKRLKLEQSVKIENLSQEVKRLKLEQSVKDDTNKFRAAGHDNVRSPQSRQAISTPINNLETTKTNPRSSHQPSFINDYNQDSRSFPNRYGVEEVLEEQSNIEGRRSGGVKTVNLSPAPRKRGAYWVFSQDNQYLLVPSSESKINEFNLDALSAVFDHSDFNPNYFKIRLIEPAIVERNSEGYQLVQKGRIEFI